MEVKFSPNLFLEVVELNRLKQSLSDEGFRKNILQNTISYGLIKKNNDLVFLNGKVQKGQVLSDGRKTIDVLPIQAINNQGLYIQSNSTQQILVPSDGRWYWVKIKHKYSSTEKGSVSLAVNGKMTGVGTDFTKTLRGLPNFPSRIRFNNSTHNQLEYDVLEVIDDEHATIMHPATNTTGVATFNVEENLQYSVVGTFTQGVAVPRAHKYPFQYDDVEISLDVEVLNNTKPTFSQDQEFFLARVRVFDGELIIQDKRTQIWTPQGKFND